MPHFISKRFIVWSLSAILGILLSVALSIAWFMPRINLYRPALETVLSHRTGYTIKIARLSAHWQGIIPTITAHQVTVFNQQSRLTFPQVFALPSLKTLWLWEPRFSLLEIQLPTLHIQRHTASQWSINRWPLGLSHDTKFSNWLLRQDKIVLRSPAIYWQDTWQQLEPIALKPLKLTYTKGLTTQQLALSTAQAQNISQKISLKAIWREEGAIDWKNWSGSIQLSAQSLKMQFLSHYISPLQKIPAIQGKIDATAILQLGRLHQIDIALQNGQIMLPKYRFIDAVAMTQINGSLQLAHQPNQSYKINGNFARLQLNQSLLLDQTSGEASISPKGQILQGQLLIKQAQLAKREALKPLWSLMRAQRLGEIYLKGQLSNIKLAWHPLVTGSPRLTLQTDFKKCVLNWPTRQLAMQEAKGHLAVNEQQGQLQLESQQNILALPRIFLAPLAIKHLNTNIAWQFQDQDLVIRLHQATLRNTDFIAQLNGQYQHKTRGITLSGKLQQVQVAHIKEYLPQSLHPKFKVWFNQALLGGVAKEAEFSLQGTLYQLPFLKNQGGQFHLNAILCDVALRYYPNWPIIRHINGQLIWNNANLTILAKTALTEKVPLLNTKVNIPNIVKKPVLYVSSHSFTTLSNYLRFAEKIPNSPHIAGFVKQMNAAGSAPLRLTLNIPLIKDKGKVKFEGKVTLKDNALHFGTLAIPTMTHATGHLTFDEKGLHTKRIAFLALGGQASLTASANNYRHQHIRITGKAKTKMVLQHYARPLAPHVTGYIPYQADVMLKNGLQSIALKSSLQGTAIQLPPPLNKGVNHVSPLEILIEPISKNHWQIAYQVLKRSIGGHLVTTKQGAIVKHTLHIGNPRLEVIHQPLSIQIANPNIALDPWITILSRAFVGAPSKNKPLPFDFALQTETLSAFKTLFHQVNVRLAGDVKSLVKGQFSSDELTGMFNFYPKSSLLQLYVNQLNTRDMALFLEPQTKAGSALLKLSTLDLNCKALYHNAIHLGRLYLSVQQQKNQWFVKLIRLMSKEATLEANLHQNTNHTQTTSQLMLRLQDVGRYLDNMGYGQVIGNGYGTLQGNLAWSNKVMLPNLDEITGRINLNIQKGYFTKIHPATSRLFSILSLQSLIQFAQFDFSRLFEEGFAFDHIYGDVYIDNGILSSQELVVKGPTADMVISGTIDFKHNALQLHVQLEPHVLESAAIATSVIALNPWVGMATMLGQQALKSPLGKLFEVHWDITGSIDQPKIQKRTTVPHYGGDLTKEK